VPRHFELRTVRSDEPTLAQMEFQLYKKYQVCVRGAECRLMLKFGGGGLLWAR
jgi:hypothetical protein